MPAGEIADAVGCDADSRISFHLKELDRAGLIHATRDGRYVRYAVHVEGCASYSTSSPRIAARGSPNSAARRSRKTQAVCKSKGGTK